MKSIEAGEDAHIDDPVLFSEKKLLMASFTPVSVVKAIKDKYKNAGITEKLSERKNPINQTTNLFCAYISIASLGIHGSSEQESKKFAQ